MTWRNSYWDMVSNFYWNPSYLGMRSINWQSLEKDGKFIKIPADWPNPQGPLYTRKAAAEAQYDWLAEREEILNHFFSIFFAIAPDALISKCFCVSGGIEDSGPFKSIGRDISKILAVKASTFGQQDGLFLSTRSAIAVELKLRNVHSNPDQFLKYLALLVCLKRKNQRFDNLALLYICAEPDRETFLERSQISLDSNLSRLILDTAKPDIRDILCADPDLTKMIADQLKLVVLTWTDLHAILSRLHQAAHGRRDALEQTFERLLAGFIEQIEMNKGTCVPPDRKRADRLSGFDPLETAHWLNKLDGPEMLDDASLRKALTAWVSTTEWGTRGVLELCDRRPLAEVQEFVDALKNGGPISLGFRWASDEFPLKIEAF